MSNAQAFAGPSTADRSSARAVTGRPPLKLVDALEALAVGEALGAAEIGQPFEHPVAELRRCSSSESASSMPIVDRNWLAWASSAASLASTKPVTSSTWSSSSASHSSRVVGRHGSSSCSGKKCGSRAATMPSQRGSRRCDGRGGAGTGATGRGRARRRAAACGSSTRPPTAGARRSRARRPATRGTRPRPSPPAPWPPLAARPGGWRRARRRRRRGPTSPSTRRCRPGGGSRDPGRRPLGERAAAAELDVVGVGADRQRGPGTGRFTDAARPAARRSRLQRGGEVEIGGDVDVPAEPRSSSTTPRGQARAGGLAAVTAERSRPVGELEAGVRSGTHTTLVPSSAPVGHEGHAVEPADRSQVATRTAGRRG